VRKSRFSVEQIVAVLRQVEIGMPIADVTRHIGVSEQTFYRSKKAYGGLQPDQARELKQLQEENARLKKLVADLSLDKEILRDIAAKKVGRPAVKREAVSYMVDHHRISVRRACRLVKLRRSVHYYRSVRDPKLALRKRMHELARVRIRYGYRRIHVLLRREGWKHGRSQTYRLYSEERLQLRSKCNRLVQAVLTRSG
jgi:putative transposase